MSKNENASSEISTTVKSRESRTDACIIDADNLNNILSAKAISFAGVSLLGRTILNAPANEGRIRGFA